MQAAYGFVSLARFSSTARALPNDGSAAPPVKVPVLVKVGGGNNLVFEDARVMRMHSGAPLKALTKDEGFRVELKDVPLSRCTVRVTASTSDEAPTPEEEGAAVELAGVKTLQGHVAELGAKGPLPEGTKLFVRVQLPGAPVFGITGAWLRWLSVSGCHGAATAAAATHI
jgi:hypothetical protein